MKKWPQVENSVERVCGLSAESMVLGFSGGGGSKYCKGHPSPSPFPSFFLLFFNLSLS